MRMRLAPPALYWLGALLLAACGSLPGERETTAPAAATGSHRFQCHAVSPGPCSYVVFNESGTVRETFVLAPGQSRVINRIAPRTGFCLAVEKPLDPTKCERLGLDGKALR